MLARHLQSLNCEMQTNLVNLSVAFCHAELTRWVLLGWLGLPATATHSAGCPAWLCLPSLRCWGQL